MFLIPLYDDVSVKKLILSQMLMVYLEKNCIDKSDKEFNLFQVIVVRKYVLILHTK